MVNSISMADTLGILLAGGKGKRTTVLGKTRAKPGVPFAGYQLIDFPLSSFRNSTVYNVHVLTEYKSDTLRDNIDGWNRSVGELGRIVLVPTQFRYLPHTNRGSGDALLEESIARQELPTLNPKNIVIVSGDQVTDLKISSLLEYHLKHDADLTITVKRKPTSEASRFGVARVEKDGDGYRVIDFVEKRPNPPQIPGEPGWSFVSENNNVWNASLLDRTVRRNYPHTGQDYDQSKQMIIPIISQVKVMAFVHDGYWEDVGTLASLMKANMDLLRTPAKFNLNDKNWPYRTYVPERTAPPGVLLSTAECRGPFIINNGDRIGGALDKVVLSYQVETEAGSSVSRSALHDRVLVAKDAIISDAIIDKDVIIGPGARVTPSSIDVRLEYGELVGENRNGYQITDIGEGHLLFQKAWDGSEPSGVTDNQGYIPQFEMMERKYLEFVLTPPTAEFECGIIVFSKYSTIPEGFSL